MSDIAVGMILLVTAYLAWLVIGYKLDEKEQKATQSVAK